MTEQETPTVLGRMLAAGISEDRARDHLRAGRYRLDGEVVRDPDTPVPVGTRPVLWGE